MNKLKKISVLLISLTFLLTGCTEESGKILITDNDTTIVVDTVSYANDIVPIFNDYCISCHALYGDGSFNLSSYDSCMLTGDHADINIIPYHPDSSYLVHVISTDDTTDHDDSPYPQEEVVDPIVEWIKQGALNN